MSESKPRIFDFVSSLEHEILKDQVLDSNKFCCAKCGTKKDLSIHHIKKWSSHPELRFEPSNCMILCVQCHERLHNKNKTINSLSL